MKKLFAILSLTAFIAVSVNAQTPKTGTPEVKKEVAAVKADAKDDVKASATPSCCKKANASCCKNNKEAKNCTAEQKAACAKAGAAKSCDHGHGHSKAEASEKTEVPSTPVR